MDMHTPIHTIHPSPSKQHCTNVPALSLLSHIHHYSGKSQYVDDATWDSIHVIEVKESNGGKQASYKLTTTVTLHMDVKKAEVGKTNLSGSLSRQASLESEVGTLSFFSNSLPITVTLLFSYG